MMEEIEKLSLLVGEEMAWEVWKLGRSDLTICHLRHSKLLHAGAKRTRALHKRK